MKFKYDYWFYKGNDADLLCRCLHLLLLDTTDTDCLAEFLLWMLGCVHAQYLLTDAKRWRTCVIRSAQAFANRLVEKYAKGVDTGLARQMLSDGTKVYRLSRTGLEQLVKENGIAGTAHMVWQMLFNADVQEAELVMFLPKDYCFSNSVQDEGVMVVMAALATAMICNKADGMDDMLDKFRNKVQKCTRPISAM